MELFLLIHERDDNNEEKIIDVKDESFDEFIRYFENKYNIKLCEIKDNRGILEQFVKMSRDRTEVKIEELAKVIGVSKSVIGRISKI